jgi:hypothetical protein
LGFSDRNREHKSYQLQGVQDIESPHDLLNGLEKKLHENLDSLVLKNITGELILVDGF